MNLPPTMVSWSGKEVKGASAGFGYCTHLSEYCHYFNTCNDWKQDIHQKFGINDDEIEEKRLYYESNGNMKMMETFVPEISSWKQNFQAESKNLANDNAHRIDVVNSVSYYALVTKRGL